MFDDFINIFLHLDDHLKEVIQQYGAWTYAVLFVIVFCETGLVVTPILPGDSLLFATGAIAADGSLNVWLVGLVLALAAILGDAVNYSIGKYLGPRSPRRNGRFLKRAYLQRTHEYFERYGGKTIIIARFVPVVRTFAPFMAGVGSMNYVRFASYNVIGAVVWIVLIMGAGYQFGRIPIVVKHFELVILGIIVVSLLPGVFEWWRHRRAQRSKVAALVAKEGAVVGHPAHRIGRSFVARDHDDRASRLRTFCGDRGFVL